jgi:hypothetical protein
LPVLPSSPKAHCHLCWCKLRCQLHASPLRLAGSCRCGQGQRLHIAYLTGHGACATAIHAVEVCALPQEMPCRPFLCATCRYSHCSCIPAAGARRCRQTCQTRLGREPLPIAFTRATLLCATEIFAQPILAHTVMSIPRSTHPIFTRPSRCVEPCAAVGDVLPGVASESSHQSLLPPPCALSSTTDGPALARLDSELIMVTLLLLPCCRNR